MRYLTERRGPSVEIGSLDDLDEDILSSLQIVCDFPSFWQVRKVGTLLMSGTAWSSDLLRGRAALGRSSQVEVMKKSILLISYIDECCVEARHHLLTRPRDISDGEGVVTTLALEPTSRWSSSRAIEISLMETSTISSLFTWRILLMIVE